MIGDGVAGACGVARFIDRNVMPNVLVCAPPSFQNKSDRALKLYNFPAQFQEAMVVRAIRISTHKIRAHALFIDTDLIRQSWLKQAKARLESQNRKAPGENPSPAQ